MEKDDIKHFVDGLSHEASSKFWKVINALRLEKELTGEDEFDLPIDKFECNKANPNDTKAVLKNLHGQGVVSVKKKIAGTPPSDKPQMSLWTTIEEAPAIGYDPSSRITLNTQKFDLLEHTLGEKVGKYRQNGATDTVKKLIGSFSNENLPFLFKLLGAIKTAAEFSPPDALIRYHLTSPLGQQRDLEKSLLRKLQRFGLLSHLAARSTGVVELTVEANKLREAVSEIRRRSEKTASTARRIKLIKNALKATEGDDDEKPQTVGEKPQGWRFDYPKGVFHIEQNNFKLFDESLTGNSRKTTFKLLWENLDELLRKEKIYEETTGKPYPTDKKEEITKANHDMKRIINDLRNSYIRKKGLAEYLRIDTHKREGYSMHVVQKPRLQETSP